MPWRFLKLAYNYLHMREARSIMILSIVQMKLWVIQNQRSILLMIYPYKILQAEFVAPVLNVYANKTRSVVSALLLRN